jgi:hypothetical protein
MEKIIKILMNRDGITYEEAKKLYLDTQSELLDAIEGKSCLSPEEILIGNLGLEMDYIFDFI